MNPETTAVLVVDDVADNRDILVYRLKQLGVGTVEEAVNGREALEAIARRSFDLMLLDIMMPEMDGFEVLLRLKENAVLTDLPVIVISALGDLKPVVRCIELGAEDFLLKPFNTTLLRARILATLEKKALRDLTRDELKRKQTELGEARTLQLALVPPPYRGTHHGRLVAIDVVLEPAKEVGGDLADHVVIDDDCVVAVLGDVSDKGAGAALVMARTHALFRSLAARPDAAEIFRSPERAMALINGALSPGNATCMFVTMLLICLQPRSGLLTYVRAGHVPPFLRRADGAIERLSSFGGPPLGLKDAAIYTSDAIALEPDDHLLIVTDGITEAVDPTDMLFGDDEVAAVLAEPPGDDLLSRLVARVRTFEAGRPASDDVAAVHLRLRRVGPA